MTPPPGNIRLSQMGEDKVPLRCAEDLVRCGYCGGTGCMFCDYRGTVLEKRRF